MKKCIDCKYKKWNKMDRINYCSLSYKSGNHFIITTNSEACIYFNPAHKTENENNVNELLLNICNIQALRKASLIRIHTKTNIYLAEIFDGISLLTEQLIFRNLTDIDNLKHFDVLAFNVDNIENIAFSFD